MSFLEDAATQWDSNVPTNPVISQDKRNFHRPNELKNSSTVPLDIHDANMPEDDKSIKLVQQFLKTSPLGVSYKGPTDGKFNPEFQSSLLALQTKANEKFKKNFTFISNKKPSLPQLNEFIKLNKSSDQNKSEIKTSKDIEDYEKLFKMPVTGILSEKLKSNLKSIEDKINSTLKLSSPVRILDGDKIKYSAADVATAFKKIREFEKEKSSTT
jgi:hypothetical protein